MKINQSNYRRFRYRFFFLLFLSISYENILVTLSNANEGQKSVDLQTIRLDFVDLIQSKRLQFS